MKTLQRLKEEFRHLMLLCMVVAATSCSNDSKFGETIPDSYTPIPDNIQTANQINMGQATRDKDYLYYWSGPSNTRMNLCAQNINSGKVTILDTNNQLEAGSDFMFQNLFAHEGYLYYYTFDPGKNRKALFRVKTDGTAEPERLTPDGYYNFIYTQECMYIYNMSDYKLEKRAYDQNKGQVLFKKTMFGNLYFSDGKFYYLGTEEDEDGNYILTRCDENGDNESKLYAFHDMSGGFIMGDDDQIYLYDSNSGTAEENSADPGYSILSISPDGKDKTVVLEHVSYDAPKLNIWGHSLLIAVNDYSNTSRNGLYVYDISSGDQKCIVPSRPISFVSILSQNQLVFSDNTSTISRMGKLFLTDFEGRTPQELKE